MEKKIKYVWVGLGICVVLKVAIELTGCATVGKILPKTVKQTEQSTKVLQQGVDEAAASAIIESEREILKKTLEVVK